ncbi:MAG: hypothetical protein CVV00_04645 [Firmicutes bacterium HGW-Firmicutes-5]|nr:MAG: hypothetical protein CVV00_04645 [Firmicutes bacterium HGW-Firmicutes-5]
MLKNLLERAKAGDPVYINDVSKSFYDLDISERYSMHCVLTLLENNEKRLFDIHIPRMDPLNQEEVDFIKHYLWAEVYNILSGLGGISMHVFIDTQHLTLKKLINELNDVFQIDKKSSERFGYGKCINVIDRMMGTLCPHEPPFQFIVGDSTDMPDINVVAESNYEDASLFNRVTEDLKGKVICGMDIGGTDIKLVLVKDGIIDCYKEYDWFPALFTTSNQLVEPICLLVRLLRAKVSLDSSIELTHQKSSLLSDIDSALDKEATDSHMLDVITKAEKYLQGDMVEIDAIGLCYPDVVVNNKVVGGECYKVRGIRNNGAIDFEEDFLSLTHLDTKLHQLIKKDGIVNIINDGPMASFTAAVEIAASMSPSIVTKGVLAYTLGTELGTGWVKGNGSIPNIPLEIYNLIIDLGSFIEKQYPSDDIRSINNFNTNLPGTIQKFCSQSGVFRMALKYFPSERPDLFKELLEKEYVVEKVIDGQLGYYVPTEPKDQRKAFLEHMMSLPELENDETNEKIWRNIGVSLAITYLETDKIIQLGAPNLIAFGRLVKNSRCFDLIKEGVRSISDDILLEVADATMANTPLMQQLENNAHYTVAQFAQAIGAVYFANQS